MEGTQSMPNRGLREGWVLERTATRRARRAQGHTPALGNNLRLRKHVWRWEEKVIFGGCAGYSGLQVEVDERVEIGAGWEALGGVGPRNWGWEGRAGVAEIQVHVIRAIWAFGEVSKLG